MRLQITVASMALALLSSRAHGQILLQSATVEVVGSAASDNYGNVGYDQTSTNPNGTQTFSLFFPGYQNSATWSDGTATWLSTATDLHLEENAVQTVSPTPDFTNYNSHAQMRVAYNFAFQVSQASELTLTSLNPVTPGDVDSGRIFDGATQIYSWANTSSTGTPFLLETGHVYTVVYGSTFDTNGSFRNFHGQSTFTDSFASSFDVHVSSVPEPSTALILAGVALFLRRRVKAQA